MKLLVRRQHFNFFEAFSDLIFCTLVLFVILFVILAISLETRVDGVKAAEAEAQVAEKDAANTQKLAEQAQQQAKAAQEVARKAESDAEIAERAASKLQVELAVATEKMKQARQELDRLSGSNRFTGRSGTAYLHIAVDYSQAKRSYWFIPSSLHDKYMTAIIGETEAQAIDRRQAALNELRPLLQGARAFSKTEMLKILYGGITPYLISNSSGEIYFGFYYVVDADGRNVVEAVIPGSPADAVGLKVDDVIVEFDGDAAAVSDRIDAAYRAKDAQPHTFTVQRGNQKQLLRFQQQFARLAAQTILLQHTYEFTFFASGLMRNEAQAPQARARMNQLPDPFEGLDYSDAWDAGLISFRGLAMDLPTLRFSINNAARTVTIGGVRMQPKDAVNIILSLNERGGAVEFQPTDTNEVPRWVYTEIMLPTGYVNRAPLASAFQDD